MRTSQVGCSCAALVYWLEGSHRPSCRDSKDGGELGHLPGGSLAFKRGSNIHGVLVPVDRLRNGGCGVSHKAYSWNAGRHSNGDPSQLGAFQDSRWQIGSLLAVIVLSLAPLTLTWFGFEFGNEHSLPDWHALSTVESTEQIDALHHSLAGSLTHTILEWSAFCTALFTVLLAFARYTVHGDIVTPVLGMALFCAGCMDAFHTLAAGRLIEATADNQNLIPFTWAICRLFNAAILLGGIAISFVPIKKGSIGRLRFILLASGFFFALAYSIIGFCAVSETLPNTMFPDSAISRPWDIAPLFLFVFGGIVVLPRLHKRVNTSFSLAIYLSIIPQVVTQLHMAFGSTALFDTHFNIAHFLKIVAYLIPFCGLVVDHAFTYQQMRRFNAAEVAELNEKLREQVQRQRWKLGEREKELRCLHELNEVVVQREARMEEICQRAVELIPPAFQVPGATFARLTTNYGVFTSQGFRSSEDKLVSKPAIASEEGGAPLELEVFVDRSMMPTSDVFLPEERSLMDSFAKALRTELELRERIARYNLLTASHAIWDWDVPKRRVFYSPLWKQLRGYQPDDLSDHEAEWSGSIHPEDKLRVLTATQAHFERKTDVFEQEYRVRCKDGSYRWVSDRGVAMRDAEGTVLRMAGVRRQLKLPTSGD